MHEYFIAVLYTRALHGPKNHGPARWFLARPAGCTNILGPAHFRPAKVQAQPGPLQMDELPYNGPRSMENLLHILVVLVQIHISAKIICSTCLKKFVVFVNGHVRQHHNTTKLHMRGRNVRVKNDLALNGSRTFLASLTLLYSTLLTATFHRI